MLPIKLERMSAERFGLLRRILDAPSPIGLEGAMTGGVIEPYLRGVVPGLKDSTWKVHKFKSNAGIVVDSMPPKQGFQNPAAKLSVMFVGHADKIRMQVRRIEKNGKIYIDSDSFLPSTLLGNRVKIFSERRKPYNAEEKKKKSAFATPEFSVVSGTVEALGAIHFADEATRSGSKGVKRQQLYIDLNISGPNAKDRIEKELGIKVGDSVLLDRPIERTVGPDTFSGAYLDNGLGSFITAELARCFGNSTYPAFQNKNGGGIRCLFAVATHEEIGRYGSRVLANLFQPDVLIGVDVNHNYKSAPLVVEERFPEIAMGKGFTISVGAIVSRELNNYIQRGAEREKVPFQLDCVGRDTGTDGMAGFLAASDIASASVGIPISNMHTVSESGNTLDIDSCIIGLMGTLKCFADDSITGEHFKSSHVDLSNATKIEELAAEDPAAVAAVAEKKDS